MWGDVVSSRCCCWVVRRYTGIPYIDSCPVPARHGCVLVVPARPGFPEMTHNSAMKKRAGQPALAHSSAPWPRTGTPKSPKWSPHPPLAQSAASDLESEAEVWFPPRLASIFIFAGCGVCTWRGREGALPRLVWGGRGSTLVLPVTWFWEEGQKVQIAPIHHQHTKNRRPWILLHVVSGPWTSIVAALDKGQCNIAVCRRHNRYGCKNLPPCLPLISKACHSIFLYWKNT